MKNFSLLPHEAKFREMQLYQALEKFSIMYLFDRSSASNILFVSCYSYMTFDKKMPREGLSRGKAKYQPIKNCTIKEKNTQRNHRLSMHLRLTLPHILKFLAYNSLSHTYYSIKIFWSYVLYFLVYCNLHIKCFPYTTKIAVYQIRYYSFNNMLPHSKSYKPPILFRK